MTGSRAARWAAVGVVFSLALLAGANLHVRAQAAGPKAFATAEQAAEAFIAAAERFDEAAMIEILGPSSDDLIHSGDPVADRQIAAEFGKLGREKKTIVVDKRNRNLAILQVGADDWPSPIPIVRKAGKWYFDAAAGRQELLFRRIGRNELDAINICRGFVEAQHEYALQKRDGAPVNQYAPRIIATAGRQDGLAWQNADGTMGGPIGENVAKAIEQGYKDRTAPYHGYYFKVLKGQGPAAPLGAMDYMVNGYMIGGFALIAAPAIYRVTGVKTFIVSQDGVVYEKDLGPDTLKVAKAIELFNPDKTWAPVFVDE
jgi:hypothetical protein